LGYEMTEEYGDDAGELPYQTYSPLVALSCPTPLAMDDFYIMPNNGVLNIPDFTLAPVVGYVENDDPNFGVTVTNITPVGNWQFVNVTLPNITCAPMGNFAGWISINYVIDCVPMGISSGAATIWVFVDYPLNLPCNAVTTCGENLVCYGDFEAVNDPNVAPFNGFNVATPIGNSPDLYLNGINVATNTANSFIMVCANEPQGANFPYPAPSLAINPGNTQYVGMASAMAFGIWQYQEGVALPLGTNMAAGTNFQLRYEAFNFPCGIGYQFMISDNYPCPNLQAWLSCGASQGEIPLEVDINTNTTTTLGAQNTNPNIWQTHTLNLRVPQNLNNGANHLVVFAAPPVGLDTGYGFIDNISIINDPILISKTASLPTNLQAFEINEPVTYTITVTNTSPSQTVNNIQITDTLPYYGLDFGSFTTPTAGLGLINGILDYAPFSLAPNTSMVIEYTLNVTAQCSLKITNCVQVVSDCTLPGFPVTESCVSIQSSGLPVYDVTQATLPNILSTDVQLSGDLTVDTWNTLGGTLLISDGSRVVMPEGTRILVEPNAILSVTKFAIIEGCNTMWKGIELNEGNVEVLLSTIQDAEKAIQVSDRSSVLLNDAQLLHNVIGLNMNVNATPINVIHDIFGETVFDGGQPFLPPYNGQSLLPGNIGYAGIVANNVLNGLDLNAASPAFPVNDNVTFRNLNIGVLAENGVEVKVNRCTFEDIRSDLFYASTPYNGTALVARSGCNFFHTGWGGTAASPLTFSGCEQGIYLERTRKAYIRQCRFAENANFDCRNAIIVRDNDGFSYTDILNNHISAQANGVVLLNNLSPQRIAVEENNIFIHNLNSFGNSGINASTAAPNATLSHVLIRDNEIDIDRGRNGIWLNGLYGAQVIRNVIPMSNTFVSPGHRGIWLQNCLHNAIRCNDVNSTGFDGSSLQAGMRFDLSDANDVSYNAVTQTYYGIRFNGACGGTNFQRNKMNNHEFGLWLSANTAFGQQGGFTTSFGNVWNGTYGIRAAHHNEAVVNQVPPYNNIAGSYVYMPLSSFPTSIFPTPATTPSVEWFKTNTPSTTYGCSVCATLSAPPLAVAEGFTSADTTIANDSATYYQYPTESDWQAKRDLYEKCLTLGTDDNSLMAGFVTAMENYHLAELAEVSVNNRALTDNYANGIAAAAALYSQQESLLVLLRVQDSILLDTLTLSQDSLTAFSVKEGLLEQLMDIKADIIALETAANTEREQTANTILTANGVIDVSETYEENERVVNEIYLTTLAKGVYELDESQINQLESIIHQCPMSGGTAVYRARAIYAMYDMEEEYNDSEVCNDQGISWRTSQVQTSIADIVIYPNPATQSVHIQFAKERGGAEIIFYNSLGQIVKRAVLNGQNEILLDISQLPPSVYQVVIKGTKISYHKLVIE
ncbi:MAG: T9SS type A sorting domain-containing protein, partial [Bacteroidia bacterium]